MCILRTDVDVAVECRTPSPCLMNARISYLNYYYSTSVDGERGSEWILIVFDKRIDVGVGDPNKL